MRYINRNIVQIIIIIIHYISSTTFELTNILKLRLKPVRVSQLINYYYVYVHGSCRLVHGRRLSSGS